MEKELQNALAELVKTTLDAKDFLLAELPEVVKQLLVWHLWESAIITIIGVVLSLIMFAVALKYRVRFVEIVRDEFYGDISPVIFFGFFYFVIATMPMFILGSLTWLQILVAPKFYLVEYVAKLAR